MLNSPFSMANLSTFLPAGSSIFETVFVDHVSQSPVDTIVISGLMVLPSISKWKGPPPAAFPEAYLKLKS